VTADAGYASALLAISQLTPHQEAKIAECGNALRRHYRAPAGGGKTFLGIRHAHEALAAGQHVLYVARNPALPAFIVRWITVHAAPCINHACDTSEQLPCAR
jgi:hypothetical protein